MLWIIIALLFCILITNICIVSYMQGLGKIVGVMLMLQSKGREEEAYKYLIKQ